MLEMTPEVLGRPQFISKLKKYIATTVPGQNVEIALSNRKSSKQEDDLHFACEFFVRAAHHVCRSNVDGGFGQPMMPHPNSSVSERRLCLITATLTGGWVFLVMV